MNFKFISVSSVNYKYCVISVLIGGWPQNNNNHYRGQYGPQQWGQRPGVPNNTTQPPNGPQWDQRFSAQSHYHSQQVRFRISSFRYFSERIVLATYYIYRFVSNRQLLMNCYDWELYVNFLDILGKIIKIKDVIMLILGKRRNTLVGWYSVHGKSIRTEIQP